MVDEGLALLQVHEHAGLGAGDLPLGGDGPGDEDQEHPSADLVVGQALLDDQVLALAALAVDDWDAFACAKARSRRANRATRRIRWVLSSSASLPPCQLRH